MLRLDWNLLFNIINLIVLYLLMKKFLIKPVVSIMEQRNALIEQRFLDAGQTEKKALELKSKYEEKLKVSMDESVNIIEKARQSAKLEYSRITGEADSQAEKIIDNARKTAASERERSLFEAKEQVAGLAMAAAAKIMGEQADDSRNLSLYDRFLTEKANKAGEADDTDFN